MKNSPIIIIGTGLAGYTLAKEFRQHDKTSSLLMVSDNDGRFYSKPLLSTAFTHARNPENIAVADASTMAEQLNAHILTNTKVTHIASEEHAIYLGAEKITYKKLILACGAETIQPPIIGDATAAILSVNDLESYATFRKKLAANNHIIILGAGLVGCEFANDLVNAGHHVEIVAPANYPLDSILPETIGVILQEALSTAGIIWHLGQTVITVNNTANGYALTLSSQRSLLADVILSAIGLRPRIDLAKKAGIKINRGILVNQFLQTNNEDIYALGDCAEVNGMVLLFIAPLLNCARALAKTLAGEKTAVNYVAMPISIKTPLFPIVVSPPPRGIGGEWTITGSEKNLKGLFYDEQRQLRGFVLTGKAISEKLILSKQLPPMF